MSRAIDPRRSLTPRQRRDVLRKTGGRCHVCGGKAGPGWHADHVRPRARGGRDVASNYLPACKTCNGARWHRSSSTIRRILRLGIIARALIRAKSTLGREFHKHSLKVRRRRLARRAA